MNIKTKIKSLLLYIVKILLFIFELARMIIIITVISQQQLNIAGLSGLIYITPGVLFPLMALFIFFNCSKYRVYMQLFTAGKAISLLTITAALIINKNSLFSGLDSLLLYGDILALSLILIITQMEDKE